MRAPPERGGRGPRLPVPELIARKRDGGALTPEEIAALVRGFVAGEVADYQMSALAMAVLFRGMTDAETTALTLAMRDSGRVARLARRGAPVVDKHSTGGVGDKISLALAPLAAACGLRVPMISGRGLGHTGGTLDKLEAIPGFRVDLPLDRFEAQVDALGVALVGQTDDLAPADRALYALRDVTATVESVPLITASILSKKLAEGLDGLVLDVKVGRGAFMKDEGEARRLARSLVTVGARAGVAMAAVLTRMDAPLGHAVGNALETAEAFEVLHGRGPDDVVELTRTLAVEMLRLGGVARGLAAERRVSRALREGEALHRMARLVEAQGGDPRVVAEPDRLPRAPVVRRVTAPAAGHVHAIDAQEVGRAAIGLGAGRMRADERVDPAVGLVLRRRVGDAVAAGDVLFEVHAAARGAQAEAAARRVLAAYDVRARRPPARPLVLGTMRRPAARGGRVS